MGNLRQARMMGGIGSILIFVPFAGVAGWILLLVAGKYLSDETQDRSIYNKLFYATITLITAGLVAASLFFIRSPIRRLAFAAPAPLITVPVAAWMVAIIVSLLIKGSYDRIAQRLNLGDFRRAARFFLIGSILLGVFGVGGILILLGLILQATAYFSIPEQLPPAPQCT